VKCDDGIVRVGGVGTGRVFTWAHVKAYPRIIEKAWLVGFYDVRPSQAEKARAQYAEILAEYAESHPQRAAAARENIAQLRCYDSLDALLEEVDVVDVCTHSRGRMDVAMAALKKGVHSMVEKPMARTWIEADRAVRAFAQRPDIFCQLNDDNVFDPRYQALHDLIRQGVIGNVQSMWLARGSLLNATSVLKSQASALENGGGCLMDYGSHGLAGTWYVLGTNLKFVKVDTVNIGVLFPNRVLEGDPYRLEVDDNARFKVLLEDPDRGAWVTVFMETTWCGPHIGPRDRRRDVGGGGFLRIEGDGGVIDASEKDHFTITRWDGGQTLVPLREYPEESISFAHEIEIFIDCVRTGTAPEIDVNFGAEVIAVCGAAYFSALQKRATTLEEFKEFSRGFVDKYGDGDEAAEAILNVLLEPYRGVQ